MLIHQQIKIKIFSTPTTQPTKLPYLYVSGDDGNNNQLPQHQIVQNERKITNNLAYNHDNYQRQKRETNNLLGDNELFGIYESNQNDGTYEKNSLKSVSAKVIIPLIN
jgi:hypothetical protein